MIYCLEDDDSSRELMMYTLESSGFHTNGYAKAQDFWNGMKKECPDLIILDIMLPDEDGISVLKKLRANILTADIPIIMSTAKGSEYDKVIGLDLGADDYLVKPFGMMDLVSRVKAVLRRVSGTVKSQILRLADIELNQTEHTVSVDGTAVELTLKEYEILLLLMKNPGKVFTREMLLTYVWNYDYEGGTRTVDVHVGTLRTKLKTASALIKTVRGVGYRMEGTYDT